MDNALEYYVFDGRKWLGDDERTWTLEFSGAACFLYLELANDIGLREKKGDGQIYIMAVMPPVEA